MKFLFDCAAADGGAVDLFQLLDRKSADAVLSADSRWPTLLLLDNNIGRES